MERVRVWVQVGERRDIQDGMKACLSHRKGMALRLPTCSPHPTHLCCQAEQVVICLVPQRVARLLHGVKQAEGLLEALAGTQCCRMFGEVCVCVRMNHAGASRWCKQHQTVDNCVEENV